MRITGGLARGIPLSTPGRDDRVRPATDRIREAVFSSLGPRVVGASVLDLYAGTGAYGLDALSRGAARAVFIEADPTVLKCLSENLRAVERSANTKFDSRIIRRRLPTDLGGLQPHLFDLVFIDPPYEQIESTASALLASVLPILQPGGRVFFESPGNIDPARDSPQWTTIQILGSRKKDAPSCHLLTAARATCH